MPSREGHSRSKGANDANRIKFAPDLGTTPDPLWVQPKFRNDGQWKRMRKTVDALEHSIARRGGERKQAEAEHIAMRQKSQIGRLRNWQCREVCKVIS